LYVFFIIIIGGFCLLILNHECDEQVPRETVEPLSAQTFRTPLDSRSRPS